MLPKRLTRILFILSRILCLLLGILILLTVSPHREPRRMEHVQSELRDKKTTIKVQVAIFHRTIEFSLTTLTWAICLILSCLICSSSYARNALREFTQKRWRLLIIMPLFLWLLLTKMAWAAIVLIVALLLNFILSFGKKHTLFLQDTRVFLFRLCTLSIFLFTMKPTSGGWPVILYLILSSAGILLVVIGIYPLLSGLPRIQDSLMVVGRRLCHVFYTIRPGIFLLFIFLFVFILANLSSYFLFNRIPHVTDSVLQVFHGKIFATGHLTAKSHPLKEFFNINPLMINDMRGDGKWHSVYPLGHSFMMMFGAFIDAPWVINPLLLALTVLLIYFLGKEIYDERTGRLAALLGALSPFMLFMSSEFMNHVSTLFYATLFLLFFAKTVRGGKWYNPVLAGIGVGMMMNTRPYTALALAFPFGVYSLWLLIRSFRAYFWRMALLVFVIICFLGIMLAFNYATNGSPTLFGYVAQFGKDHNPGFGKSGHGGTLHTPQMGYAASLQSLNVLNKCLHGWPIPTLMFALILFLSGRKNKWDYLLVSVPFSLAFAYFFYWYTSWECGLGPRFLYESSAMLILLTARGILCLPDFVQKVLKVPVKEKQVLRIL